MRYGLLLLGFAIACSAERCNSDRMLVTVFDGAPPNFIELVEKTMKRKLGPQTKVKVIMFHPDFQDGNSAETYLNVVGVPPRDSMWRFVKPDLKTLVNVPIQEPFAKARECEKKGFKVKTQHLPLSMLYKFAKEQGLLRYRKQL